MRSVLDTSEPPQQPTPSRAPRARHPECRTWAAGFASRARLHPAGGDVAGSWTSPQPRQADGGSPRRSDGTRIPDRRGCSRVRPSRHSHSRVGLWPSSTSSRGQAPDDPGRTSGGQFPLRFLQCVAGIAVRASEDIRVVPTTGTVRLPPAPRSIEALGRHHTLEAALAELADNSIDAGAAHVLIRFVQRDGRLEQLIVVDDGRGMSQADIDIAMTVGGERAYGPEQIGRFGFGLKAASFSQADVLTVLSRTDDGPAVGRRWQLEHAKRDFSCDVVSSEYAAHALQTDWDFRPVRAGQSCDGMTFGASLRSRPKQKRSAFYTTPSDESERTWASYTTVCSPVGRCGSTSTWRTSMKALGSVSKCRRSTPRPPEDRRPRMA